MTCKTSPAEDFYFIMLVAILEKACTGRKCRGCSRAMFCDRWFNAICLKSSLGSLDKRIFETQVQKLREMGILTCDIVLSEVIVA